MSDSEKKLLPRKKGLGRGLDALLGEALRDDFSASQADRSAGEAGLSVRGVSQLSVSEIKPNPAQPRRHFAADALDELAASIKRHGIVQPIVVRPFGKGYQIVAGERRWRAAQKARIHDIPAIIRDYSDAETLEIALLENIQRKDLNPIEEAQAYRKLCDEFGHSQAELGKIVQKSRSHVANIMRLLELPQTLSDLVIEEKLSMGHARALLGADDSVELAMVVVRQGLSVRETEALVRKGKAAAKPPMRSGADSNSAARDADIKAVESHLGDLLGLKVNIKTRLNGKAGSVTFDYNSLDQLDMLCQRLTGESF